MALIVTLKECGYITFSSLNISFSKEPVQVFENKCNLFFSQSIDSCF